MNVKKINLEALKSASQDLKGKISFLESKITDTDDEKTKSETLGIIEYLKSQDKVVDRLLRQFEKELHVVTGSKVEELERMFNDVNDAYRKALSTYH